MIIGMHLKKGGGLSGKLDDAICTILYDMIRFDIKKNQVYVKYIDAYSLDSMLPHILEFLQIILSLYKRERYVYYF